MHLSARSLCFDSRNHCLAVALWDRKYRLDYSQPLNHFALRSPFDHLACATAAWRISATHRSFPPVLEPLLLRTARSPDLAPVGTPRRRDPFMHQGPEDSKPIPVPGGGKSKQAQRRRNFQARKAAHAAEEAARLHRLVQDRAAADEAEAARRRAARLERESRAAEAQRDNERLRAAVADAELAQEESRQQRAAELLLEPEATALARRLAAASARAATEEARRLDLEERDAALRAELQARQAELDDLRGQLARPPAPGPTLDSTADVAVALPAAGHLDCARAATIPGSASQPDPREAQLASLTSEVRRLRKDAFQRSVATATAFLNDPSNELLSAPTARRPSVSPPPADRQPAARTPPSPPAARKLVLTWTQPKPSTATTPARRPAQVLPPWAPSP